MNNIETYYEYKKGRPQHIEHRCDVCKKTYKNASTLATHKQDAKKKKTKCIAPTSSSKDGFIPPSNLIVDNIGPKGSKSVINITTNKTRSHEEQKQKSRPSSLTKSATTAETVKEALKGSMEWKLIEDLFSSGNFLIPQQFSEKYAQAFLFKGASFENKNEDFAVALCTILERINIRTVSYQLLQPYCDFFQSFIPMEEYQHETLVKLYTFARKINAPLTWILQCESPLAIVSKDNWLSSDAQVTCARVFSEQKWLYSCSYFDIVDSIMASEHTCTCIYQTVENYFTLILQQSIIATDISKEQMLLYSGYEKKNGYETLENWHKVLEVEAQHSFSNAQLICLLGFCSKHGYDLVKLAVRTLAIDADADTIGELVESLAIANKDFKEKRAIEEEEKKYDELRKQCQIKQLEDQKKQFEEAKQLQQQQFTTSLRQSFDLFAAYNQFQEDVFAQVVSFIDDLQKVAVTINKELRAEQLVTLGLLLVSQKHTTLIQLATGAGKSLMLGILAQYLNQTTSKKVIVVVPTSFLHAYQQHHYCPTASKIPEDMNDPAIKQVFYSDFNRFIAPEFIVPADTIILVDEFHELFFGQQVSLVNGQVVSVISKLLSAAQVIGVSATYRGDKGIKAITSILQDSVFIKPPQQLQEKELQLEVIGRVSQQDILYRAVVLAQEKAKTMPVILFCEDPLSLQQQFVTADVFAEGNVGVQLAVLDSLRESANVVVLTTSAASKGVDFVFAVPQAYVIQTALPNSFVQLKQDSGRGVRGSDLPIVGTVITSDPYRSLQQLELGLAHAEQFDKLYSVDYLQSLQHLQKLQPTTEAQLKALAEAVVALNEGKSFSVICFVLSKSTTFKKSLPKSMEFKAPAPILTKRLTQEKSTEQQQHPFPLKQQRTGDITSFFLVKSKPQQSKEEARNAEQCLREHCGDIVDVGDDLSQQCRMCSNAFSQLGFKCTICLAAYYCTECRKFDANMKINDGAGQPVNQLLLLDEMQLQYEDDIQIQMQDEDTQMRQDIIQQHSQNAESVSSSSSSSSSSVVLGLSGTNQQKSKREQKAEQKQAHLEKQMEQSERSKISIITKRSVKKEDVVIDELQWKKTDQKNSSRQYYFACVNKGCTHKCVKSDRWKHICYQ